MISNPDHSRPPGGAHKFWLQFRDVLIWTIFSGGLWFTVSESKKNKADHQNAQSASYLIRQHRLAVLQVFEDVVGCVQRANLGGLCPDEGGQVDEPEAVTVTKQALGPHVRNHGVFVSLLLGQLDLLGQDEN